MRVKLRHGRLAKQLARSRMSQNAWALKLGLSRGHLSNLVNGKRPYPGPATRRKLMKGLQLSFEDLFEVELDESPTGARNRPRPTGFRFRPATPWKDWRKGETMQTLKQDVLYALRMLTRHPAFTAVAVLTLALGIGANTAIFSAVHAVLLSGPPYPDAERLSVLQVDVQTPGGSLDHWSYPLFDDFRARARQTLPGVAAYTRSTRAYSLAGGETPQKVEAEFVSA
ncbi:MAG TPA: hypothetical protein VLU25_07210, partial [Acidobacteriota bacterium]|nr:hypothetical protein [Acidobacteriota bacterium]